MLLIILWGIPSYRSTFSNVKGVRINARLTAVGQAAPNDEAHVFIGQVAVQTKSHVIVFTPETIFFDDKVNFYVLHNQTVLECEILVLLYILICYLKLIWEKGIIMGK